MTNPQLGVPRMSLIVNKALHRLDFEALKRQVENTYNAEVAEVFAENEEMLELASGGIFILAYPDHPFTEGIKKVGQILQS